MLLSTYLTQVQRLVHDTSAQFWTTAELTDHINEATAQVVADTACLRQLITSSANPLTITAASWAAGVVSFSASGANNIQSGQTFVVAGVSPAAYNGTYTAAAAGSGGVITAALGANPGVWSSGGTINPLLCTTPAQEVYTFPTVPLVANSTTYLLAGIDVLNVNIIWGTGRYPLFYLPWTRFNARRRQWVNYQTRPDCFSVMGQNQFYLGPIPDQVYTMEVDTVYNPPTLVSGTDDDQIATAVSGAVQYYAAYKAFLTKKRKNAADEQYELYQQKIQSILHATQRRRILSPYR